jgi:hypothetical protein
MKKLSNIASNGFESSYCGKVGGLVVCSNGVIRILAYKSKKKKKNEKNH